MRALALKGGGAIWAIDGATAWTAAARIASIVTGPLTLLLIATRLTPDEQGVYYTFAAIVAVQTVFDGGLGSVVQSFASHETAFLAWRPDGTIDGVTKGRLAALVRRALWWSGGAALALTVALVAGGTVFFERLAPSGVDWRWPWVATSLLAGASLVTSPLLAALEGCGAVLDVARLRTGQTIAASAAAWIVMLGGGGVWACPALSGAGLAVAATWMLARRRRFLLDLLRTPGVLSWRREVWPMQWRVAVSHACGYLAFQLFTPVLFARRGPALAGQMGMSFALLSALFAVSMSWVTSKVPAFGERIARRDFAALDALFLTTMGRAFTTMALGGAAFLAAALALSGADHPWSRRFLPPLPLALLVGATLMNHVAFGQSVYLRAHKREPFLVISVAHALVVGASTLFLGDALGATGMMAGFLVASAVISLGGGSFIFAASRRSWHG